MRAVNNALVSDVLRQRLHAEVDRQLHVAAGDRVGAAELAQHAATRVDFERQRARRPSQVLLEDLLDAVFAELIFERVAGALQRLVLGVVDGTDVTEHVRGARAVGIDAQCHFLRLDAGELVLSLFDVHHRRLGHVLRERDRQQRRVLRIVDACVQRVDRHPEHRCEVSDEDVLVALVRDVLAIDGDDVREPIVGEHPTLRGRRSRPRTGAMLTTRSRFVCAATVKVGADIT